MQFQSTPDNSNPHKLEPQTNLTKVDFPWISFIHLL